MLVGALIICKFVKGFTCNSKINLPIANTITNEKNKHNY